MPEGQTEGTSAVVLEKLPILSIGFPVYNGEEHIREILDFLLSQNFHDFELIISDNASTDKTGSICLEYAQKDSRIRFVRQMKNQGPVANFKFVLAEAQGEYFMWVAHDDLWSGDSLSAGVEALSKNQNAVASFGRVEYVNQENEVFLVDTPPYGLCNNQYSGTATYLNTNIPDHLIYGMFRRSFLLQHPWRIGISCPEKIIIFNAVVSGGFIDVPNMALRIRYKARTRRELESFGFYFSRWQSFYMSYLMAMIIWNNFSVGQSIKLLLMLLKYRTPITHQILGGKLKEHPGRTWLDQGTHRVADGT